MADLADKVTTATLQRGKVYSFPRLEDGRFIEFKRNVPVVVSDELADILEELVDTVQTTDNDEIEKPVFEIDREATVRSEDDSKPRRMRLRMVAVEDTKTEVVARRTAPAPGVKKTTGLRVGGGRH